MNFEAIKAPFGWKLSVFSWQDVLARAALLNPVSKNLDPESISVDGVSLHYHISMKGKSLDEVGARLNRLTLIRRISLAIFNDFTGRGNFLYEPSSRAKGLVKVVSINRYETRAHHVPLLEELKLNLALTGLDPSEAIKKIDSEIQKLISDYVVDKIAKYRSEYLTDIIQYMSPEQIQRAQPQIEVLAYVKSLSKGLPGDFWTRAPELMKSSDSGVRSTIASA